MTKRIDTMYVKQEDVFKILEEFYVHCDDDGNYHCDPVCNQLIDELKNRIEAASTHLHQEVIRGKIEELRKIEQDCPNCNNDGYTVVQTQGTYYVTRDMASDACDMSLEGQEMGQDEFEQEQCQWCYEMPHSKFNIGQRIADLTAELNKGEENE